MELDDLKEAWRTTAVSQPKLAITETLTRDVKMIELSGKGIRRTFTIEMVVVCGIFISNILLMWLASERIATYMYKIIFVTGIGCLPGVWRLYQSQKQINSLDYSQDIRSNMIVFLKYYKTTLRIYKWSSYAAIILLLLLLFTDQEFMALPFAWKTGVVVYILAILFLTAPYIHMMYGKRTVAFEAFLAE